MQLPTWSDEIKNYLATMIRGMFVGVNVRLSNLASFSEVVLLPVHKVDGIMKKEVYLKILQLHIKSVVRWVSVECSNRTATTNRKPKTSFGMAKAG